MGLISQLLPQSHVLLDAELTSKKRLFEQVGLVVEGSRGIARSVIFDSLFSREKLGSTGIGQGIAIPHGRIKGLKEAVGVFIRLAQPLPFDAPDGRPVNLVFALLVPEQGTQQHLDILSDLADRFSDPDFRSALGAAAETSAVLKSFSD
jgi:nitrogen PTS system EIIA component